MILIEYLIVLLIVVIIQVAELNPLASSTPLPEIGIKPLEIKGPTLSEVNETISFIVTSGGLPVEGAKVFLAGYEEETDGNGVASFRLDISGSFKAIAKKEGYESDSTLLWVFPKGRGEFKVRSTKSVSDPQLCSDFDASGRMEGFNYARIKSYYTYDDNGRVYPIIISPGGGLLSDEAVNIIKEMYDGDVPRNNTWIRVPNEVHLNNLRWMISRARDWGLKVLLMAEVMPPAVEGGHPEGIPSPPLRDTALKSFLEQRRKEALILTKFAEEQKVEIFDPIGPTWFPEEPRETAIIQLSLYKELLPEIKEIFNGKLLIHGIGRISDWIIGLKPVEFNYSGFDYIAFWFGCGGAKLVTASPEKWRKAVQDYIDYADYLSEKYNVKFFPMYISSYEYAGLKEEFIQFMNNFNSTEEGRLWFMKLVFEELIRRNITAIDVHPLWFFGMNYEIGWNDIYERYSYWPTKKALNLAAEYIKIKWNKEKKYSLQILKNAELMYDLTLKTASNSHLKKWISEIFMESLHRYKENDNSGSIILSSKLLDFFMHIKNPLNITIDGRNTEWNFMDPVYYNPSQAFPWFNAIFCYGKDKIRDMGNLKAVYILNDKENLYFMLDFYGKPPKKLPFIAIDTSNYWSHNFGEEFHIPLNIGITEVWRVGYKTKDFDPQGKGSEVVGKAQVGVDEVVEVKIPLGVIGNPRSLNILIWQLFMCPWGDMNINIINWTTEPFDSFISFSTKSEDKSFVETIKVSGFIYPAHPNAKVTLIYRTPEGASISRVVNTSSLGEFEDILKPEVAGIWTVRARWDGDQDHIGAESAETSFTVERIKIPAKFIITDLRISPKEAIINQKINVSVKVTNIGEEEGSHIVNLKIDGEIIDSKNVTLTGGDTDVVTFMITRDVARSYAVEVNGLKDTFRVIAPKPAEFIVTNLTILPMEVEIKQTVTVSVKVINIGEQSGSYIVNLKINNVKVDTKTVTLFGGESTTIIFELVEEEKGTYEIDVSGLKGTFLVKEPLFWKFYKIIAVAMVVLILVIRIYLRK